MIRRYRPARRAVLAALRRRPRALLGLLAWSPVEALPALLAGLLTARAVDEGFLAGRPRVGLAWLAALAVAVVAGGVGTDRVYRCLAGLVEPFRDELLSHVVAGALRRATSAGRRPDAGSVARLTHQVELVRDTFGGMVMVVRGFAFAAVGATLGLLALAPVLVALVLPPLLAGLALFLATLPAMVARQRAYVLTAERLAERAGEVVAGVRDVVACGAEGRVAAALDAQIDSQAQAERGLAGMAAVRSLSLAVGGWLPLVVLLAAAPWLVGRGMTAGALLGALVYVLQGLQPALHTLVRGLGGGGLRLVVTLDRLLTADQADPRTAVAAGAERPAGDGVALRGVTFRYGPAAEPVVEDLDLDIPPGEHLTIVGPSGVGKSTLAALLAGTLRPDRGEVRLGGVPIDRLDLVALTRHRVLIPQEAYVFTGTLADNLTYLRPAGGSPGEGELARAVDALGLGPLVARLGGHHAELTPEALSAGERQLVALARAYLSPARVVLLDEATCHLDPAAEERVERAFAARPGTLMVIAHRLSSARRADRVLVLDGGRAAVAPPGSDPAGVAGDPDRLDPGPPTGLGDDPGQVIAHGARGER